jgi:hypothetical protein
VVEAIARSAKQMTAFGAMQKPAVTPAQAAAR